MEETEINRKSVAEKKPLVRSMEEAKSYVPESMRKKLGSIWHKGMEIKNKAEAKLPENNKEIPLGTPSKELNNAISKALGKETDITEQVVRNFYANA